MKIPKSAGAAVKANSTSVTAKNKFKNKDNSSNGIVQKGAKHAVGLLKKGVFSSEVGDLVKGNLKGNKKKKKSPAKLSPQVQLGLKLDAILEEKSQHSDSSPEDTPKKKGKGGNGVNSPKGGKNKKRKSNVSSEAQGSISTIPIPKGNMKKNTFLSAATDTQPPSTVNKKGNLKRKKMAESSEQIIQSSGVSEISSPAKKSLGIKMKKKNTSLSAATDTQPPSTGNKKGNLKRKKMSESSEQTIQSNEVSEISSPAKKSLGIKMKSSNAKLVITGNSLASEQGIVSGSDIVPADNSLDHSEVLKAVKALIVLNKEKQASTTKLLDTDNDSIFLYFVLYIPSLKRKIVRFELEHSLVTDTSEICLFVPDVVKNNPDETKEKYEEILKRENVTGITEVMPLTTLSKDYTQYSNKRKLSDRFDFFLVDGRISHRVFPLCGKRYFHDRRRTPTAVNMSNESEIKSNIAKSLKKTGCLYKAGGESFSIQIGHFGMSEKQITDNLLKVWEMFPTAFGVNRGNIRKAFIQGTQTNIPALPIFVSISPPDGNAKIFKDMVWKKQNNQPIVGDLSTIMNHKVVVYPSGEVSLKKDTTTKSQKKKPIKAKKSKLGKDTEEEEEQMSDEGSDDDLGGRADMLVSESSDDDIDEDIEEEVVKGKKGNNVTTRKNAGAVKQATAAKTVGGDKKKGAKPAPAVEDSSGESDLDKAEELYLKGLEEELLKAKSKKMQKKAALKIVEKVAHNMDDNDDDSDDNDDEEEELKPKAAGKRKKNPPKQLAAAGAGNQNKQKEKSKTMPKKAALKIVQKVAPNTDDDADGEEVKPKTAGKRKKNPPKKLAAGAGGNQNKQSPNPKKSDAKKQNLIEKRKAKKMLKKAGAQKNSSGPVKNSPSSKKQTSQPNSPAGGKKNKKQNSFQGIKADQTKKTSQKKRPNKK